MLPYSVWQETQWGLVGDFLDLFLPPLYEAAVEADYPQSSAVKPVIEGLAPNIEFPETKLLRLQQYPHEATADVFERRISDWPVILAFDLLEGFGHGAASKLQGAEFDGLKQLANVWGLRLAREFQRVFQRLEFFTSGLDLALDCVLVLRQLPARELGDMIRAAATPAYVRAGQIAAYQFALLNGDLAGMSESQSIVQASDVEIQRGIDSFFGGYSSQAIGRYWQRLTVEFVAVLREVLSSDWFKQHYLDMWPLLTRQMSWYVGYRLRQNMEYDPARTARLLEAVGRHKEIAAVFEQYRNRYDWGGDTTKAIRLGWQAVAPKYFQLPGKVEDIKEDDGQEKLIGMAEGLQDYAGKNPAIDGLTDGFLGKLAAYLAKAAKNQETDYLRKQTTDGNRILSEALHAEDFAHADAEEEEEESDEEILSRLKEKYCPSGDSVAEAPERKETLEEWWRELTEKERTAATLMDRFENQQKVAEVMGISQPAVSQLLWEAFRKYSKIKSG